LNVFLSEARFIVAVACYNIANYIVLEYFSCSFFLSKKNQKRPHELQPQFGFVSRGTRYQAIRIAVHTLRQVSLCESDRAQGANVNASRTDFSVGLRERIICTS